MSYYVHSVPGRLRIKIPSVKDVPGTTQQVRQIIENIKGVEDLSINPITGSVVVRYDADHLRAGNILETLKHRGYFDETLAISTDQVIDQAAAKAGRAVGKALFGLVLDRAFEGSPLALLSALI